jgi:hypothetical protein
MRLRSATANPARVEGLHCWTLLDPDLASDLVPSLGPNLVPNLVPSLDPNQARIVTTQVTARVLQVGPTLTAR